MGDYLRLQYALRDLNHALDDDYKKLSDKFNVLKLSHNRQKACLLKLKDFFGDMKPQELYSSDLFYINKWIDDALFSDGRVNFPIVKRKKKGGK